MTAYDLDARADAIAELAPISQGGSGQVVTVTTPFVGVFDPTTDTTTTGAPTVQTGSGVEETYSARSIDGTLIRVGDTRFLLSPVNTVGAELTPPVADRDVLTKADGSVCAIKRVERIAPAGLDVMFILQLRGS